MKKYFLISVLALAGNYTIAQTNYINAFVINTRGDSISGRLDYRDWKNNPESIDFIDANNENKVLFPADIKGFFIPTANEVYTSFDVEIDMLPGDADDAINANSIDSSVVKRKVFLLQLVASRSLKLYELTENRKEHFYFVTETATPIELIHHFNYDEKSKQVEEISIYRQQLNNLFGNCPEVATKMNRMRFRKNEIQKSFLQYFECSSPGTYIDVKKSDPVIVKFGITAGIAENTFNFEGSNYDVVDDNYSNNVSPLFGISVDVGLPRNQNKWHIVNDLLYKSYQTSSSFMRTSPNGYQLSEDVDFGFSYAQLSTLLRYVFQSNSSLRPYINLGIANAFLLSENQNNRHIKSSFGTEIDEKAIDGPRKYEFSLQGGAGISLKSILIEARVVHSKKSFSSEYSLNVNAASYQLLLTYQFR